MKLKSLISLTAVSMLALGVAAAEAKDGNRKSGLIGGGVGVAAGVAGTLLYQKMKGSSEETTGTVKARRNLKEDDDDDDEPAPRTRRGVDRSSTGSVQRASASESCNVKSIDLFDRKGNFVKAERMRVCQ